MLDAVTKRRIDDARDILVGKIPDPKSQVEQITIALIYKFMDDMDSESEELGGEAKFFSGEYQKYSWRRVFNKTRGGQEILLDYREALQKLSESPTLPQIFHTIFRQAYLPYNDPETLKSFLKIIDQFEYDHSERLGDAFEYLLSVLGSQGDAGQFRTPRHIIDFMVDIVEPKIGETILDPACGTAGFLISAYKYILRHNSSEGKSNGDLLTPDQRKQLAQNICGYDISPDMVRLSLVNMYLHRITEPRIAEYDTLTSDAKWNEYFDVILANPPFMSPKGGIKPHARFSIQSKRSEALFVDYIIEHLTKTGRGAVIVPEGVIFKTDSAFVKLRKMLINDNYLYGVISLPQGVFNPYSGVKTSILLFDKVIAKLTNKILFAKVENDGFSLGAQRRPIEGSQLESIASAIKDIRIKIHRNEECASNAIITLVKKNKIIETPEHILSSDKYIEKNDIASTYKLVNINDVCELKRGESLSSKQFVVGNVPVIAGGQTQAGYHNTSNRPSESITVSCSGAYAGYVSYHKTPIFATDCFTIFSKSGEILNQTYLYYILKYKQELIYSFQTGMGQPHVSPKDFQKFEIPLPPIREQQAIVAELDSYQKIIDAAKTIVDNYKPQIDIDPNWPMVELGEICKFVRGPFGGSLKKDDFVPDGYAVYEQQHAINNQFDNVRYFISEKKFNGMRRFELKTGDIVMSCSGTMGKIALVPNNIKTGIINQALLKLTTNDKLLNKYLLYWMQSEDFQKQISNNSYGAAIQNVASVQVLKSIKIPLPELNIQQLTVNEIEKEQSTVRSVQQLIEIFTQKKNKRIAKIWNE